MDPALADFSRRFQRNELSRDHIEELLKGWQETDRKLGEATEVLEDVMRMLEDLTSHEFSLGRDKPIRARIADTLARLKGGSAKRLGLTFPAQLVFSVRTAR